MPLETGTFISDLVATNPVGSDPLAFADDHLRLVKSTIKSTFPNITGAVTKTHTEINTAVDQAGAALARAGGTMTGALTLSGAPTVDLHASTKKYVDDIIADTKRALYPVGSIYVNAGVNTNPATLLGFGTWVAFGAGRVMVGLNGSDTLFDALEETGGSKDAIAVSHTHTFSETTSSAGEHSHSVVSFGGSDGSNNVVQVQGAVPAGPFSGPIAAAGAHTHSVSGTTASSGSSGTNANIQPYITVAMWKRTA
jgi:hypothetical protein